VGGSIKDTNSTGATLNGITVTLYAASDTEHKTALGTATADTNGAYTIDNLVENGTYVVVVAKSETYGESTANVTVNNANVTDADIVLNIKDIPVSKISVTKVNVTLDMTAITVGGTLPKASVEVEPANSADVEVKWALNGNDVEDASTSGEYIATITVTAKDGFEFNNSTVYTLNGTEMESNVMSAKLTVNSSSSSSSSSGGTTTSKPVKNPDGSTTTTKKDNKGTVTETTKHPDGSKTVVETKKDGTVTTKETASNGDKTETVAKADGSSETKMETKSGATSTTSVDTTGKVEAKVELPKKAIETAVEKKETVTLPMPEVPVTKDTSKAPTVEISAPDDTEVKVKVPVEKPSAGTVAVIVHPDGTEEIVKMSAVTENGVALNVSGDVTVKIVDNSKDFHDVASNNWAKDSVDFVTSRELFKGTSESTFAPEAEMTRSMLVTVLFRLDGEKKGNVNASFNDVTGGTWYTDAVAWASSTGVVQGVGDGSFAPDVSINRESLCVMIYRYAKTMGLTGTTGSLSGFGDASNVSGWASEAMAWAVGSGIVNGKDGGALDPQGTASRAEVAAILERLVNLNAK